jgi:hypothetical protein
MEAIVEKYKYAELSDEAKAKARDEHRESVEHDWSPRIDEFDEVLGQLGFDVDTHDVQTYGGKLKQVPTIHWQVSYCQGDGASFEGYWHARTLNVGALLEDRPTDEDLRGIGARLMLLFMQQPESYCRVDTSAPGSGVRINDVTFDGVEPEEEPYIAFERTMKEIVKDIGQWMYRQMRDDYEDQTNDAYIGEWLAESDHDFDEDGHIA